MARIGVEQSLSNVESALQERGHEVVSLHQEQDAQGCDCCVTTGLDNNVMGMSDTATQGLVVEAEGLSAEEVCNEVEDRLHRKE
ncbi:hypothetical protein HNR44_001943 [Geomicrobium halophilum]|uniref:UPF0180 protein HNR44_001943 n=1 Tax=Geomicrobium halophilum TaxID=549000 RepID=A0A841PZM5_9BACL|nr:YkuS family protein [Geomicrobium halophilum]MBB6449965.1 hypothetical protein [Geomicrobium halophilum]